MPGRVNMDQPGPIRAHELKKEQALGQDGGAPSTGAPVQPHSPPMVNGAVSNGQNGSSTNGGHPTKGDNHVTNGGHNAVSTALSTLKTPPELDQSWREGPQNKSLGTLLDRLAQQCYVELNETLTKMQDIQVSPQPTPQANGMSPLNAQDNSENSLQKKRMLLEFAHDQRDRFTKTLVLSDWSRIEKDMATLIDIKVWQDKQRFAHDHARFAVGQLKVDTFGAKMPNPNIEGAIELLATGKASWVPDFGYVPPKRLTAKQLLRTLRDMNVILASRLNLNEELPPYMQDFTIADGRATFAVPEEFEVDLSVADEDPSTPFYFIDIRLLFTPSSGSLDERLRGFLEGKVNEILATKGLQGCYEFLHNFVLTHKINVLRGQAQDMIQDKWFDCLKFENLRRSLTVQYWADMPGAKSWIEFGIDSGNQKGSRSIRKPTPKISVRWFKKGTETKDPIKLNWQNLNLEQMILTFAQKHAESTLSNIRDNIRLASGFGNSGLSLEVVNSSDTTEASYLTLKTPYLQSSINVRIEPITGKYSITPRSPVTANAEGRLNSDASIDVSRWLTSLLCALAQEKVAKQAELVGWLQVTNRSRQDLAHIFGADVLRHSLYVCNKGWTSKWALGVSFTLSGQKWWIVQIEEKPDQQEVVRKFVTHAKELPEIVGRGKPEVPSQESLISIERLAVAEVSFWVLSQELKASRVPHVIERPNRQALKDDGSSSEPAPASMYIRFSALMRDTRNKSWKSWALDYIRLTEHGMEPIESEDGGPAIVRHNLRITLKGEKMRHLKDNLSRAQDKNLAFKSPDGMAIRIRTQFGEPLSGEIRDRLLGVERLDRHVSILTKHSLKCMTVNQTRLAFEYNAASHLSAQVCFTNARTRLKLEPSDNPQLRIRHFLENGLNNRGKDLFGTFVHLLAFTLPLMEGFRHIEQSHLKQQSLTIHAHGVASYSMRYKSPLLSCAFDIRTRAKAQVGRSRTSWVIALDKTKMDVKNAPATFIKAIGELWKEKGEHWYGSGVSIVAELEGIKSALQKVDEVVQKLEVPEGASKAPESASVSNGQKAGTANSNAAQPNQKSQEVITLD